MSLVSDPVVTGIVPASNLQTGDRFWNTHHHAFRQVVETSPNPGDGTVFVAFKIDESTFGSTWLDADESIAVQLPRQEREAPVPCRWCRTSTTNHTAVCDRPRCGELEHQARTRSAQRTAPTGDPVMVPMLTSQLRRSIAAHPSNGGGAA